MSHSDVSVLCYLSIYFLIHIPYDRLRESIVTTKLDIYTITDHIRNKSKLEALETK